jgi:RND family efflux transporter MFP subunit
MVRDRMQANIERTEALIAQKAIYAPWDGRLGLRDIAVGKYVAPGQAMVWIQSVDPIYADFNVSETDYGRISVGQQVVAHFSAYPDQVFAGTIITHDARVSPDSRMITVRASLANPDRKLLPGMYVNVTVIAGAPQPVVTIPQTAITYSLYGDSVYAVVPAKDADPNAKEPQLVVERRLIKSGGVREGKVEVLSGLKAGEKIVTAGQNKIEPGSSVKIDNSIALNLNVDRMTQ